MKNVSLGLILALSLADCSKSEEENAKTDGHKQLYNAVNQPLEQAKDVEKQVFDSAEQQKKQADGL